LAQTELVDTKTCDAAIHIIKKGPADYKAVLKSNKAYTDPDFPHDDRAIHPDERRPDITWARARHVVKDASTFGAQSDPWDIAQGELGDCYFLSACSSIAERDERIKKIFVPEVWSYPEEGIYAF